jgi:Xaa-Pro aminopeptidase
VARSLSARELNCLRALGEVLAICVTRACFEARPGLSEHQIAGMLAGDLYGFGATPTLLLVGADERARQIPCPTPTESRLQAHLLLRVGARRDGLLASMTRLVHFGELPNDLRRAHDAVTRIAAACHLATRPGIAIRDILAAGTRAATGSDGSDRWDGELHGEPAGLVVPEDDRLDPAAIVQPSHAFAWSPWLPGTRSEDTLLATLDGPIVVTATPDLPVVRVDFHGAIIEQPDILVR